eukprot:CAMPEP_0176409596 /NCGR_PEP_ID=MMETSP0127-20121128/2586_1 /TAXON_ID=938130 /ORGANISM="Platyophrya macrostoma, Strain WH" /LENGTH=32 /DNA_ID= /DNA_START= /DNA_END= /DNA_ORIENTATION=
MSRVAMFHRATSLSVTGVDRVKVEGSPAENCS